MGKRKNHHKIIITSADLTSQNFKVTQFHTSQKMPRTLKGVPDLHVLFGGISWWIEIKPRYANYMRDQMSDKQWQWFHERRIHFNQNNRYAIVTNAEELKSVVLDWEDHDEVYMEDYYWDRYNKWRRGR